MPAVTILEGGRSQNARSPLNSLSPLHLRSRAEEIRPSALSWAPSSRHKQPNHSWLRRWCSRQKPGPPDDERHHFFSLRLRLESWRPSSKSCRAAPAAQTATCGTTIWPLLMIPRISARSGKPHGRPGEANTEAAEVRSHLVPAWLLRVAFWRSQFKFLQSLAVVESRFGTSLLFLNLN